MNIKPKSPIISLLSAGSTYLFVGVFIADASSYSPEAPVFAFVAYLLITMAISYVLLKSDINNLKKQSNNFKRIEPFESYGSLVHNFQYSFKADSNKIIIETIQAIIRNLEKDPVFVDTKVETITDLDKKLIKKDAREFIISQSKETLRGGKVTHILNSDDTGSMYIIEWWFLVSGIITKASIISFIVFTPLTIIFWLISRLRGNHNLALNLREIYPAYYESHDLLTIINSTNKLTMEILIKELSDKGIDTSDLKMQQAQSMNINISGGKASFGSVVQGAMNNIGSSSGGRK